MVHARAYFARDALVLATEQIFGAHYICLCDWSSGSSVLLGLTPPELMATSVLVIPTVRILPTHHYVTAFATRARAHAHKCQLGLRITAQPLHRRGKHTLRDTSLDGRYQR
jgi:hypothetical protein